MSTALDHNLRECLQRAAYGSHNDALESLARLFSMRQTFAQHYLESSNETDRVAILGNYNLCNKQIIEALAIPERDALPNNNQVDEWLRKECNGSHSAQGSVRKFWDWIHLNNDGK